MKQLDYGEKGKSWKTSKSPPRSVRIQQSNYKQCSEIPRFELQRWESVRSERLDKHPEHQPLRARPLNYKQLMRNDRNMMSPHHSHVPYHVPRTPNHWPWIHTNMHGRAHSCAADNDVWGLTMRERQGGFGNVNSKCQLKIKWVLGKVRVWRGWHFSHFWHNNVYLTWLLADMMGSTLSVP